MRSRTRSGSAPVPARSLPIPQAARACGSTSGSAARRASRGSAAATTDALVVRALAALGGVDVDAARAAGARAPGRRRSSLPPAGRERARGAPRARGARARSWSWCRPRARRGIALIAVAGGRLRLAVSAARPRICGRRSPAWPRRSPSPRTRSCHARRWTRSASSPPGSPRRSAARPQSTSGGSATRRLGGGCRRSRCPGRCLPTRTRCRPPSASYHGEPMSERVDLAQARLRVARPSDDLEAVVRFYRDGLGFDVLYEFRDHDGLRRRHARSAVGRRGTSSSRARRGHRAGRAPTEDNLLVLYLPDRGGRGMRPSPG